MLPSFEARDATHIRLGHAIPFSNNQLRHAFFVQTANLYHVSRFDFGGTVFLSAQYLVASFCHFVGIVVCACANKQMLRVTAAWIVTLVTNYQAVWDRAIVQLIGKTVRPIMFAAVNKRPVALVAKGTLPFPTFLGLRRHKVHPKLHFYGGWRTAVSLLEARRLALDPATLGTRRGCYICYFATTAMAVAIGDFVKRKLGLDKLWGMIAHVISSFQLTDHALGCFQHRQGNSIGELYYSTGEPI
jgi:hypothetical protein